MKEGSLEAPTRHPIPWDDPDFYDEAKLDAELRRVFDICHGCRRCFNLCDSFPRLFDLIDESETGELDSVDSKDFKPVADACTLCDMCFMTKCPYVPPHEFDLDFPHLMLRYRAVQHKKGEIPSFGQKQITETDRNGRLAAALAPLANWAARRGNRMTRSLMEKVAGVHRDAELPRYTSRPFARRPAPEVNANAPAYGQRKAVIYATCFANYNEAEVGEAARRVLAHNGVETQVVYPECCGMPQMEQGDLKRVADKARNVARTLKPYIDDGWDIVALVPSCGLMLKFEWPLVVPDSDEVKQLAAATRDISQYIVDIARNEGLAEVLKPLDGPVSIHLACHARAQNMGKKGAELLQLLPRSQVKVVERCSGHGGSWGVMKENFETAMKVGRPVFRQARNNGQARYVASECPLAALHIGQGMERGTTEGEPLPEVVPHPVLLLARAYGLMG